MSEHIVNGAISSENVTELNTLPIQVRPLSNAAIANINGTAVKRGEGHKGHSTGHFPFAFVNRAKLANQPHPFLSQRSQGKFWDTLPIGLVQIRRWLYKA